MSIGFTIRGRPVNDDAPCYVIAEIGCNHQGKVDIAKKMFLAAKNAGADAVKLQKRDNRTLYTKAMYDRPYDHRNSYAPTYGLHRDALELDAAGYRALMDYAAEIDITCFATPFDLPSADFLERFDMPAYKIASGDLRNLPLIKHVAAFGKPIIISTGGASAMS